MRNERKKRDLTLYLLKPLVQELVGTPKKLMAEEAAPNQKTKSNLQPCNGPKVPK